MDGAGVLGIVLAAAVQTEESRSACALAEVSGFMPLANLASPIAESSLESLVCHAYYYIPTTTAKHRKPFYALPLAHYYTQLEVLDLRTVTVLLEPCFCLASIDIFSLLQILPKLPLVTEREVLPP